MLRQGSTAAVRASAERLELLSGWYYWHCFPGCLPDSEPIGPFATEAEALADAREVESEYQAGFTEE